MKLDIENVEKRDGREGELKEVNKQMIEEKKSKMDGE